MKGITDLDFVVLAYTPSQFAVAFAWNLPLGVRNTTNAPRIMNETYQKFKPKELAGVKVLFIFGKR